MCFFQTGLIPGDWQRLSKHPRPLKQHQGKIIVVITLCTATRYWRRDHIFFFLKHTLYIHCTSCAPVVCVCVCDLCNTQCVYWVHYNSRCSTTKIHNCHHHCDFVESGPLQGELDRGQNTISLEYCYTKSNTSVLHRKQLFHYKVYHQFLDSWSKYHHLLLFCDLTPISISGDYVAMMWWMGNQDTAVRYDTESDLCVSFILDLSPVTENAYQGVPDLWKDNKTSDSDCDNILKQYKHWKYVCFWDL